MEDVLRCDACNRPATHHAAGSFSVLACEACALGPVAHANGRPTHWIRLTFGPRVAGIPMVGRVDLADTEPPPPPPPVDPLTAAKIGPLRTHDSTSGTDTSRSFGDVEP